MIQRGQRGTYRGRGGGREGNQERIFQPASAKMLEDKVFQYEPQELLLWLTAERGVEVLLGTKDPQEDSRRHILAAAEKACKSERSETLNHLLISLRDSALFKGLPEYLSTVYIHSVSSSELRLRSL